MFIKIIKRVQSFDIIYEWPIIKHNYIKIDKVIIKKAKLHKIYIILKMLLKNF